MVVVSNHPPSIRKNIDLDEFRVGYNQTTNQHATWSHHKGTARSGQTEENMFDLKPTLAAPLQDIARTTLPHPDVGHFAPRLALL
jgi:hypothetical protein